MSITRNYEWDSECSVLQIERVPVLKRDSIQHSRDSAPLAFVYVAAAIRLIILKTKRLFLEFKLIAYWKAFYSF